MQEFLKELGINLELYRTDDGDYSADIKDSNEYGKIFSKLDKSDLVEEEQECSTVTFDNSNIQYVNDDYTITIIADFENDVYKLHIREN